jgi:hypothetical protein
MSVLALRVAARHQASRPVPIDKEEVGRFVEHHLVPDIVSWLKRHPHQDQPIGAHSGIAAAWLNIDSVDRQETLQAEVYVKSVEAKGKWAAVLGGSSGKRRWEEGEARVQVILWLNGALSPADFLVPQAGTDRLQPLSGCKYETCLPYGLYSILTHELTHAAEAMFREKTPKYLRMPEDDPKRREVYVNDPGEVRAFLQQVVDEAVRGAKHLREHSKSNDWLVKFSLKMSTTWKEIEGALNRGNRAKILKAVYDALDKEGLLLPE